jgi:hypothetical protein
MIILPAALGIGNMYDFFTTRYLIVSMIPLLTLCLVEVVRRADSLKMSVPYRAAITLLLLLVLLLHGRLLLVRHVDRAGLYDRLEQVADVVNSDNAILLCEYSSVAGALEHLFGVPALGLDGEHLDSYHNIEKAWCSVMEKYPNRSAYYLTPFDSLPRSSLMNFEFVRKFRLDSSVLVDRRWDLPVETRKWGLTLYLYKVDVHKKAEISDAEFTMSPANMGFSRFSGCRLKKGVTVSGVVISADTPFEFHPAVNDCGIKNAEIWLMLYSDQSPEIVNIFPEEMEGGRCKLKPLGKEWYVIRLSSEASAAAAVRVDCDKDILLTQAFYIGDNCAVEAKGLLAPHSGDVRKVKPFVARWARQNAAVTLSPTGDKGAVLLMFMTPPAEIGGSVTSSMTMPGRRTELTLPAGQWRWSAIPVTAGMSSAEINFSTTHPFDPQLNGFHSDLILFMGYGRLIQR